MKTLPYGEGVYRRRIRLTASPGAVKAELEDDFHHFATTLHHDGKYATQVVGEAIRYPWTTCPAATLRLEALAGLPLSVKPVPLEVVEVLLGGHSDDVDGM